SRPWTSKRSATWEMDCPGLAATSCSSAARVSGVIRVENHSLLPAKTPFGFRPPPGRRFLALATSGILICCKDRTHDGMEYHDKQRVRIVYHWIAVRPQKDRGERETRECRVRKRREPDGERNENRGRNPGGVYQAGRGFVADHGDIARLVAEWRLRRGRARGNRHRSHRAAA